jgi:hypothetical protein
MKTRRREWSEDLRSLAVTHFKAGYSERAIGHMTNLPRSYIDILQKNVEASIKKLRLKNFIFQHDRDPKHTAKLTQKWLRDNKIIVLEWVGQSPDVSPLENLWSELDRRVKRHHPRNKQELWQILQREWNGIDSSFTQHLVASLPARLKSIIKQNGGPIKY